MEPLKAVERTIEACRLKMEPLRDVDTNDGGVEAQNGALEGLKPSGGTLKSRIRIRIRIEVRSRIRLRINGKSWVRIRNPCTVAGTVP